MLQHVARLEVLPVGGFLEREILRERVRRVAHVKARHHHARALARVAADPLRAEVLQFLRAQRIRGARIAPAHVPEVLGEHRAIAFALRLLVEERLVERAEPLLLVRLDIGRDIDVRRQLDACGSSSIRRGRSSSAPRARDPAGRAR
jgi:hypothetical protein